MPTPFDLLSQKLDDEDDPDDQLRLALGQDQGANLAGGPDANPNGKVSPPGRLARRACRNLSRPRPMCPGRLPRFPGWRREASRTFG